MEKVSKNNKIIQKMIVGNIMPILGCTHKKRIKSIKLILIDFMRILCAFLDLCIKTRIILTEVILIDFMRFFMRPTKYAVKYRIILTKVILVQFMRISM